MKEEIVGGLRNAVDHGIPLDQAVQSFINAGYNQNEVREAATMIGQGSYLERSPTSVTPVAIPSLPVSKPLPQNSQPSQPSAMPVTNSLPQVNMAQPQVQQGVSKRTIGILITIFLLLVILLVVTLMFGDKITAFFA